MLGFGVLLFTIYYSSRTLYQQACGWEVKQTKKALFAVQ
jgi:hypothetical protein